MSLRGGTNVALKKPDDNSAAKIAADDEVALRGGARLGGKEHWFLEVQLALVADGEMHLALRPARARRADDLREQHAVVVQARTVTVVPLGFGAVVALWRDPGHDEGEVEVVGVVDPSVD